MRRSSREQSRSVDAPAGPAVPRPADPVPAEDLARSTGSAGPVDYRHPRRRTAPAEPAPMAGTDGSGDFDSGQEHPFPTLPGQAVSPEPVYEAPAPPEPDAAGGPPLPVAGDASGWTMEERLHNQIWGMFEDLTRYRRRLPQRRGLRPVPFRPGAGPAARRPAHPWRRRPPRRRARRRC